MATTNNLSERVSSGEAAAVARAISKIEDGAKDAAALMKEIYQRSRGALVIGITGAPGAGKSSLVDKLAMFYRQHGDHGDDSARPIYQLATIFRRQAIR